MRWDMRKSLSIGATMGFFLFPTEFWPLVLLSVIWMFYELVRP